MLETCIKTLKDKRNWTQLSNAVNLREEPCNPRSFSACAWSLKGVLERDFDHATRQEIYTVLLAECKKIIRGVYSVDLFNSLANHNQIVQVLKSTNEKMDMGRDKSTAG